MGSIAHFLATTPGWGWAPLVGIAYLGIRRNQRRGGWWAS